MEAYPSHHMLADLAREMLVFEKRATPPCKVAKKALGLMASWVSHSPIFSGCNFSDFMLSWDSLVFS